MFRRWPVAGVPTQHCGTLRHNVIAVDFVVDAIVQQTIGFPRVYRLARRATSRSGVAIRNLTGTEQTNNRVLVVPITTMFKTWESGKPVVTKGVITYINYPRTGSFFALLSAVAHFVILWKFDTYTESLRRGINRFRWIEYAFSSSLIMVLGYMMWGHFDFV